MMPKQQRKPRLPARVLAERLIELRRLGLDFDLAWEYAKPAALAAGGGKHSREWAAVLDAARPEFEAAWHGRPTVFSRAISGRDTLADGLADYIVGGEPVAA